MKQVECGIFDENLPAAAAAAFRNKTNISTCTICQCTTQPEKVYAACGGYATLGTLDLYRKLDWMLDI